ncbi:GNAT family N-acetyltransferase [Lutimonas halocynthiae]|uniref:GNAT family N-acetyltransferase n=1 Tax=Lutimonas halocynthiae TaxID=1446477 RepID=UPI0025B2D292|nr:GNAT family N-acetyltransferase [Lutimonas halocynthiae]MDN3643262.1 GNAT family N-acetyltransferase [Lutimonas halocynthiae]
MMIRKHNENDLEQIMKVWYTSSTLAHPFLNLEFVEKVKSDMRNMYIPNSETWVYEIDSTVVGFISMMDNEIAGLFVLPEYHSRGIGSKLVNFVTEFNDKLEVEVFKLNKIGRSFYNKYGFIQVKEFVHKDSGEVVLRLKK